MAIEPNTLAPEVLAKFPVFAELPEEQRIFLSYNLQLLRINAGQRIISSPVHDHLEFFVVSGSLAIELNAGEQRRVAADSELSSIQFEQFDSGFEIVAIEDTEYFSVHNELLELLHGRDDKSSEHYLTIQAGSDSHEIVHDFYQSLAKNRVTLPSLPELVKKISHLMSDDKLGANKLSQLIASDANITARLLRMANSPFYRGLIEITQLSDAITRLGLTTTRHLITAFTVKDATDSQLPNWIKKRQLKSWKNSIQLGALCYVLAKQCDRLVPEEAMLAGLLHNIGELPLLNFAAEHPYLEREPEILDEILADASSRVGAIILHKWNLPKALVTAVQHSDTWFFEPYESKPTLTDVLIVARLYSLTMHESGVHSSSLPTFDQLPSYRKLCSGQMDPDATISILENAREQVAEMKALLNS